MENYKYFLFILLIFMVVFLGLGLGEYLGLEVPHYLRLDKSIYNLFSPLVNTTGQITNSISNYFNVLRNINEIIEENRQLKKEVSMLEARIHQLKESLRQNERLEMFNDFLDNFKSFYDYEVQGALVVGYGPTNFEDIIIINQGSRQGIEEDMPVIGYNGVLVGLVSDVGANSAQVIPIHSPRFAVGGIIQRSRDLGLVRGEPGTDRINVMENIELEADIEIGDHVLTSGLSDNYPKYLPIGQVAEIEEDNYGLSYKAKIQLYSSQYTLEEVLVITDF